jgi:DNA-directed RNA polymerase subunit RPC12/RpoP
MPISAACLDCAATFKVPDQLAGKNVKCPKCGKRTLIPSAPRPTPDQVGGGGGVPAPRQSEEPYRLIHDEPAPSARPNPVTSQVASFGIREIPLTTEQIPSTLMRCPSCGATVSVPGAMSGKKGRCPACDQTLVTPSANSTMNQAGRFLSLPWLVLIFVFGFLPWSEVSCNAKDVHLRVTQSGYQTLYGGVSSSYNVMETVMEKASTELDLDKEQLSKTLEAKRSDLLVSFSPFAAIFWAATLASFILFLVAPLSNLRLKYGGPLAGLMVLMLVVQLVLGTPLERGVSEAVHQVIEKDPGKALVIAGVMGSGETVWFWLVFVAVFLMAGTEFLTNLIWKNPYASISYTGPTSVLISAAVVAVAGVAVQILLWQVGVMRMESHLAELNRAEREKVTRAKAAEEKQREERQRQQAELERQAERQRLETERANQALSRQAEQQRLEADRKNREQRLENERLRIAAEQERQKMEMKAREELEARLAEKKLKDEKDAELARQEAKAQPILKSGQGFAARKFPKQAIERFQEVIDKYPDTSAAATARELLEQLKKP